MHPDCYSLTLTGAFPFHYFAVQLLTFLETVLQIEYNFAFAGTTTYLDCSAFDFRYRKLDENWSCGYGLDGIPFIKFVGPVKRMHDSDADLPSSRPFKILQLDFNQTSRFLRVRHISLSLETLDDLSIGVYANVERSTF